MSDYQIEQFLELNNKGYHYIYTLHKLSMHHAGTTILSWDPKTLG
jgi:hypothetical protein